MKKIFLICMFLGFSLNGNATSQATLRELLEQKSIHYSELNLYYKNLLKAVKGRQDKNFCQEVFGKVKLLDAIFQDDLVLIKSDS